MNNSFKIPYSVSLYLRMDSWAVLCGVFWLFLIGSRTDILDNENGRVVFVISTLLLAAAAIAAPSEYGLLRFLGIKKERKDAKILNDNIKEGHIDPGVSDEALKEIYYALTRRPEGGAITGLTYGGAVVLLASISAIMLEQKNMDVVFILIYGMLATALLTLFANFFTDRAIAPAFKECGIMLKERGLPVSDNKLFSIKNRFYYFAVLLALIVFAVLTFSQNLNPSLLILSIFGLIMAITISRVLSSSIYEVLSEVEIFARKLPAKEKIFYASGSLAKEAAALSKSLNESAEILYAAAEKERKLKEELQEQVKELDKWYHLTIGRELRMVELKEEIKKTKSDLDKYKGRK